MCPPAPLLLLFSFPRPHVPDPPCQRQYRFITFETLSRRLRRPSLGVPPWTTLIFVVSPRSVFATGLPRRTQGSRPAPFLRGIVWNEADMAEPVSTLASVPPPMRPERRILGHRASVKVHGAPPRGIFTEPVGPPPLNSAVSGRDFAVRAAGTPLERSA